MYVCSIVAFILGFIEQLLNRKFHKKCLGKTPTDLVSVRQEIFTRAGRSLRAASRAAPCAGCIQTSIPRRSAPRLRSDLLPGVKPHPLLLPCSCTWPGNDSEAQKREVDEHYGEVGNKKTQFVHKYSQDKIQVSE